MPRDINDMKIARTARFEEARAIVDKAKEEERHLSEEEEKQYNEIRADLKNMDADIAREEDLQRLETRYSQPTQMPIRPDVDDGKRGNNPADEKRFKSFGEQLQAVYRASIPGGSLDSRLLETRAATGMGEAVPADGGFLVQTDFAKEILKRAYETGILASRVRRLPLSTGADSIKINAIDETSRVTGSRWGGVQVYWKSEGSAPTAKKPKLRQIKLEVNKLIGLCYATDELVKDAAALGSVVSQAFAEEFGFVIDDAIINGDGTGKPLGILNSGALISIAKETGQASTTLVAENAENMYSRMWGRSKRNAVWFIHGDVWPQLFQLNHKIGTAGVPVFMPPGGIVNAPFGTLFGRPILEIEQCQTLGTKGDIYFVDLGEYVMCDKGAMESASSIHVQFTQDEMTFRFTYRVDGQPIWNSALTPFKGTNTRSPYVTLAAR